MARKITLTNNFHNTSVNLMVENDRLTLNQIKRAKRQLCGCKGCCCSGEIGTRGTQDGFEIEPDFDPRTNEINGAFLCYFA